MRPPSLGSIGAELKKAAPVTHKDQISDLQDLLALSNEALIEANKKIEEKDREIGALKEDNAQRDKALRYAYRAIWIIPLLSLAIIGAAHLLPIRLCVTMTCVSIESAAVPDLVQVALVTGSFALIISLLIALLRGVFPSKSHLDGNVPSSQVGEIVAQFAKSIVGRG